MDSRQQFEWWQCEAEDGPQVDPIWMMYDAETNTYGLDLIQSDWKTWKASRESLVVELPEIEKSQAWMSDYDDGCVYGRNCARNTIEYRLKALGIRTK